jgi:hypothetical protein
MDRTTPPADVLLGFVREAAERRRAAERHLRETIAAARALDLPLSLIADAAGLSVSRVHAVAEEVGASTRAREPSPDSFVDDVLVVAAGRAAADEYLEYSAYVCQPHRPFRDVRRMGFYRRRRIEPYFPLIRARFDAVEFSSENAARLRSSGDPLEGEAGELVDTMLRDGRRTYCAFHDVFLLTSPNDPDTLVLGHPIQHTEAGRGSAWTQGTRYTSESSLRRSPLTTNELD